MFRRKEKQFTMLNSKYPEMIKYMSNVNPPELRELLKQITENDESYETLSSSALKEIDVLSRKADDDLRSILLCTCAFISISRSTRMRSINALSLQLSTSFTPTEEGILINRIERKCGSIRNVEKDVVCHVVHHIDPTLDPILHLAEFLHDVENHPRASDFPFRFGFRNPTRSNSKSLNISITRRFIAVLHSVAIAVGLPGIGGSDDKKLHCLRVMCENSLIGAGATALERQLHIGWTTSSQAMNYSAKKHQALNARTAYLLAGRQDKDIQPHPMWRSFNKLPLAMSYWKRICIIASQAGFIHGVEFDSSINELDIVEDDTPVTRPNTEDDVQYPQLQTNSPVTVQPVSDLAALVASLKVEAKDPMFPQLCATKFAEIGSLIDEGSIRGNFALKQSDANGKALVQILLLVALVKSNANLENKTGYSWLQWIEKVKQSSTLSISTKNWSAFKHTSGLF